MKHYQELTKLLISVAHIHGDFRNKSVAHIMWSLLATLILL
jgi:hypothetical protein